MNPLFAQTGVDYLSVIISRQEIESCDISSALNVLESLLYDSETVRMFQGQLGVSFHGYDSDPRELYQIPEVRKYLAALDSKFPYWFYFLSTDNDTIKMIAFCLCHTREIDAGLAWPEPNDMQAFLITHFDAVNHLFQRYSLNERINEEISDLISDYFFPSTN